VTGPWIAGFGVLAAALAVTLVVVTGVVRRALAVLEADGGASGDLYSRSLQVAGMYGGLAPGATVPQFVARTADGATISSSELLGEPALCLFVAAGCGPCKLLLAGLAASPDAVDASLLLFVDDTSDESYRMLPPSVTVLADVDGSAAAAFESKSFPQGFAVDRDWMVQAVAIPNSLADLRELAGALEGGDRRQRTTQTAAA